MAKLKSGTRIYGSATIDSNLSVGNIIATGQIIGDGSQLTGIVAGTNYSNSNVASYLTTYSGDISANSFIGDGSQLTGLPAGYSDSNVASYLTTYSGILKTSNTTATTSTTSGALQVAGGAGIGSDLIVGNDLYVGVANVSDLASMSLSGVAGIFVHDENNYAQLAIVNQTNGANVSADFTAYADNGDINSGWIDMGITSSSYVNQQGEYGITHANDGYIFMSAPAGSGNGGNLYISTDSTGTFNDIVFSTGGFNNGQEQARFKAGIGLKLIQGTPSIDTTSGALTVVGGVGIGGNLNVKGNVSIEGNLHIVGNAITFTSNNVQYDNSLIYLATDNTGDVLDIGIVGSFTSGTTGYQHSGLVRDASDGVWKLFANVAAEPVTTVDFTSATYSNLQIGNLFTTGITASSITTNTLVGTITTPNQPNISTLSTVSVTGELTANTLVVSNATASTSTTTGALIVAGGIGVGDNITVNGSVYSFDALISPEVNATNHLAVNNGTGVGDIVSIGYLNAIKINTSQDGPQTIYSKTGSDLVLATNSTSGYGITVSSNNANVRITSTKVSTSTNTGALTVEGGVGIAGNVYAGNVSGTYLTGTLLTAAQPNITSVGTLGSLTVTGNVTTGNVSGTYLTGTLLTAAQTNITSIGTLTSLTTSGTISAGGRVTPSANTSIDLGGSSNYWNNFYAVSHNGTIGTFTGSVTVGGGIYGTLSTASQTNITSVGTLGSLSVTGNVTAGNVSGTYLTGTLLTSSQTTITSVGTLGSLSVTGNVTAGNVSGTYLTGTLLTASQTNITGLGTVTTGTWNGSVISSTYGGTGVNNGGNTLTLSGSYTLNQSVASGASPTFTATNFSGTAASLTAGAATTATSATTATNLGGSTTNTIPYQSGSATTSYITAPTTSSTYLQWTGSAFAWASVSGGATLSDSTVTNASYYIPFSSATSGTWTTAYINSSKLYFNPGSGTLYTTVIQTLSDATVKENVKTVTGALDIVNKLEGKEFTWKDTGAKSYGVIAQEVEKIITEGVVSESNGQKTVNYAALSAFFIEAIKAQDLRIQELEEKINRLTGE